MSRKARKRPRSGTCPGHAVAGQQAGEERLRAVFRLVMAPSLAPDEGVDGIPVLAAQCLERRAGGGIVAGAGMQDERPVRGGKGGTGSGRVRVGFRLIRSVPHDASHPHASARSFGCPLECCKLLQLCSEGDLSPSSDCQVAVTSPGKKSGDPDLSGHSKGAVRVTLRSAVICHRSSQRASVQSLKSHPPHSPGRSACSVQRRGTLASRCFQTTPPSTGDSSWRRK